MVLLELTQVLRVGLLVGLLLLVQGAALVPELVLEQGWEVDLSGQKRPTPKRASTRCAP